MTVKELIEELQALSEEYQDTAVYGYCSDCEEAAPAIYVDTLFDRVDINFTRM